MTDTTTSPEPAQDLDLRDLIFSAKIDYVTLETPHKLSVPNLGCKVRWSVAQHHERVSLHDPSAEDVAAVLASWGSLPILELEVAVDVRPAHAACDASARELLERVMVEMFALRLDPRKGPCMLDKFRARYRHVGNRSAVAPFNKLRPRPTDQLLYSGRRDPAQVKCYLKTVDQGAALSSTLHVCRVEARMSGSGLESLGLAKLDDLQGFKFRRQLMPYFRHVQGTRRIKRSRRTRASARLEPLMRNVRELQHKFDCESWQRNGVGAFVPGGERAEQKVRLLMHTPINDRLGQALKRLEQQFNTEVRAPVKVSPLPEAPYSLTLRGGPGSSV